MSLIHDRRVRAAAMSLEAATGAFLRFLDTLPESVTAEPLVGGWTPSGHACHLALTNDVFAGVLKGGAGCTGPIAAFEGTSDFSDAQWNFDAPPRVAAPAILVPPAGVTRQDAARLLRESAARLRPLIESMTPAQGALCVQLPWNKVSLYQMTEWAAGHTLRHLSQVGRELHQSTLLVAMTV
jgi:DinB family protein